MKYSQLLKNKKAKLLVWGCGYIGISTLAFFAKNKVQSIGYDIDSKKIKDLNKGKIDIYGLKNWFGFDINKIKLNNFVYGTSDLSEIKKRDDIICHFICVPTEKNGYPNFTSLKTVIKNIFKIKQNKFNKKTCIIIESTLTPNTTNIIIKKIFKNFKIDIDSFHYAVAPRRDWFENKSKTLETLDRVYGCNKSE